MAPNTGGESFGIVLLEAMAAGTPVVASDLEAFVRVLGYGAAGRTFHNEDSSSLAEVVNRLLAQPDERERLRAAGRLRAAEFDWSLVAEDIVDVYEAVAQPSRIRPAASIDFITAWTPPLLHSVATFTCVPTP